MSIDTGGPLPLLKAHYSVGCKCLYLIEEHDHRSPERMRGKEHTYGIMHLNQDLHQHQHAIL
jgi:hypothetical protein